MNLKDTQMEYSPELTELLAEPPSRQSKTRIVWLRLIAEVGSALNSLTDEQLTVLPDHGQIAFHFAAVERLDIEQPWVRFIFGSMRDQMCEAVEGDDWLNTDVGWLRGLHEWTLVDAKLRGAQQVPLSWAQQSRGRRIVLVHTFIHVMDPLALMLGMADDFMGKATHQSRPRVRKTRRWKRSSHA